MSCGPFLHGYNLIKIGANHISSTADFIYSLDLKIKCYQLSFINNSMFCAENIQKNFENFEELGSAVLGLLLVKLFAKFHQRNFLRVTRWW